MMMPKPETSNALARQLALNSLPPNLAAQSGSMTYSSQGHLLIIGPEDLARLTAEQLTDLSSITLLALGDISSQDDEHLEKALNAAPDAKLIYAPLVSLQGWLGAFELQVMDTEKQESFNPAKALVGQQHFDLVLDLSGQQLISSELSPPGYYAPTAGSTQLNEVIAELSGMRGEFEKPTYIQVNHDICAHADRGKTGCTRCLDVCPADAISSHNHTPTHDFIIAVNDALCHGAGSCTTACPTGALSFTSPQPPNRLSQLRQLIKNYQDAGGTKPALLIYGEEAAPDLNSLPDYVLPLPLEEAAGVGMEIWFSLLCAGCTFVSIQISDETPASLVTLLNKEVGLAGQLLETLGHPAARINLVHCNALNSELEALDKKLSRWHDQPATDPFEWEGKRGTLNAALERLYEQAEAKEEPVLLSATAPFGQVSIQVDNCTLCMSCVALCPTGALRGGNETAPRLAFMEGDCVQCGLCEASCPEKVITLEPRFVAAPGIRLEERTLKEEEPFHCISCGKAFGNRSTITSIMKKLENHSYFQGEAAKRLQMCEDCRVRDSYRELAADPEAQLRL
ncbi:4Fe-4S dicluster domain-containing protein [Marinospirillum sp.]|uniref:4Fe-4S dicluster domain-containing protein n=1 Tax=Marinospirillum sp. TaxID=2183934 RepID=UPI002870B23D|nr:4Fe-4S dicluster domain-containing protein [Marinospirillum sp.]MDR9466841.1 4Fe-4S dicluster domain-containing protein [Marinospirillum sp.]